MKTLVRVFDRFRQQSLLVDCATAGVPDVGGLARKGRPARLAAESEEVPEDAAVSTEAPLGRKRRQTVRALVAKVARLQTFCRLRTPGFLGVVAALWFLVYFLVRMSS